MSKSYYRQIALAPLGPEAIEELLGDLLGSDPSLDGLPDVVRERTAGNPFFIEEVVQSLVEAGSLEGERGAYRLVRPVEQAAVPASVQAVLSARIDRLPEREKAVLQAAAVIGKEFSGSRACASRRAGAGVARGGASQSGGGRVRLRAGALSGGGLRVQAPAHPGGGLRLAARRAPVRRPRGGRAGDRRGAPGAAGRVGRAAGPALGERRRDARGGALERARRRVDRDQGSDGVTAPLAEGARADRFPARLRGDGGARALGADLRLSATDCASASSHEEAEALFTEAERLASRAQDLWSRAILLVTYGTIRSTVDGRESRVRQARSPGDRLGRGIRRPRALHGRFQRRPTPSS